MQAAYSNRSVLVVDDESFILATTSALLVNLGYPHVCTAENANEALRLVERAEPPVGLVITDLNMPDGDGVELLRRFAESGYRGDIILFSGEDARTLSMAEGLARARQLSVIGSIAKPLDPDELTALLDKQASQGPAGKQALGETVTPEHLAEAIEARQLEPWFQPKVSIASRAVLGFEALARWPLPQGMIFPDAFIPVAEQNGLIDAMTYLMAEKVAAYAARWDGLGLNLQISLNVSMASLENLDFPDRLSQAIGPGGRSVGQFQLEVTESRLMEDFVAPLDALLRLRLKKFALSIDDFGTGHSNLSQLRDLPFDELKLDRSYVHGAGENSRAHAILESTVDMARKLGLEIVAEGVEDLDDWHRVAQLGCDQVQGYFVSKPLPADQVPAWIAGWDERQKALFG